MAGDGSRDAEWFKTAFSRLYPLVYDHRDDASAAREAAQLIETLGLTGREIRVLDVCCGAGRHTAAFRSMGFSILGIDLSMDLLEQAGARQELSGLLARGDIRALPFRTGFDLVLKFDK